jgi:hypothetical protein
MRDEPMMQAGGRGDGNEVRVPSRHRQALRFLIANAASASNKMGSAAMAVSS